MSKTLLVLLIRKQGGHVGVRNNNAQGHYAIHYRCIEAGLALLQHAARTVVVDPNGNRALRANAFSQVCCHAPGLQFSAGLQDDPCDLRYGDDEEDHDDDHDQDDDNEEDDHDEDTPEDDGPDPEDDD